MVKEPELEADRSNLMPKISGAEPALVHTPHDAVLGLSTGDYSVVITDIVTTVIMKNVFTNMASFRSSLLFAS
jgi:hypothetical protein